MDGNLKPALAELLGTFMLVFIGAGVGALAGTNGGGIVAVALAHGTALVVIIYTWGAESGAHVNPAVTLGIALAGKISWAKAAVYVLAQFVGGTLAAFVLRFLIRNTGGLGATTGSLTGDPSRAILIEAILTFFLMSAVFSSGVMGRNGNAAGLAIGFVLIMDILMGGSLTGASMNPARTFGPALATGDLSYFWIYVVGPLVGAAGASLLYAKVFMRR